MTEAGWVGDQQRAVGSAVNCTSLALKETANTQLQLGIVIWRCGSGDANSSDLSGEARNMDFHVKSLDFSTTVCAHSLCAAH